MSNLAAITADCARRWPVAKITPSRLAEVNRTAARLVAPAAKARYLAISAATGVPWFVVAVIHERESGQDFTKQLGQGDPLDQISQHVPRGMGPYLDHPNGPPGQDAFYRCAVDTLQNSAPYAARWKDWTAGGALTLLILYNGTGYEDYHNEISPYDWGATDQEEEGKYTGDGKYSAQVWDTQIGCAALLKAMMALDPSIEFAAAQGVPVKPPASAPSKTAVATAGAVAAGTAAVGAAHSAGFNLHWFTEIFNKGDIPMLSFQSFADIALVAGGFVLSVLIWPTIKSWFAGSSAKISAIEARVSAIEAAIKPLAAPIAPAAPTAPLVAATGTLASAAAPAAKTS